MDNLSDLTAVRVPDDEVDLYNVTESGWYAVDDEDKAVIGPFESLDECDQAIGDRNSLMAPQISPISRAHIT
ncbi:MAG: hypothetical protein PSV46_20590 [Reyranella sp.]|nr:hypothetical protein [Reyranella sp.]